MATTVYHALGIPVKEAAFRKDLLSPASRVSVIGRWPVTYAFASFHDDCEHEPDLYDFLYMTPQAADQQEEQYKLNEPSRSAQMVALVKAADTIRPLINSGLPANVNAALYVTMAEVEASAKDIQDERRVAEAREKVAA